MSCCLLKAFLRKTKGFLSICFPHHYACGKRKKETCTKVFLMRSSNERQRLGSGPVVKGLRFRVGDAVHVREDRNSSSSRRQTDVPPPSVLPSIVSGIGSAGVAPDLRACVRDHWLVDPRQNCSRSHSISGR